MCKKPAARSFRRPALVGALRRPCGRRPRPEARPTHRARIKLQPSGGTACEAPDGAPRPLPNPWSLMAGRPWPGWAPSDAEVWLQKRLPRPDARGGREGDGYRLRWKYWEQQGRPGRAPTPAAGAVSGFDGGPTCGVLAAGGDGPSSPEGRRRGKTPNGHGGRTSIDNVVVQRVRGRAATTTTKGKGNEFRRRFNPKKAGGHAAPSASRGSHCATTGNVVCPFFLDSCAAAVASRFVDPCDRACKNNVLPQGQLREIRVFDLRRGPVDARRKKIAARDSRRGGIPPRRKGRRGHFQI